MIHQEVRGRVAVLRMEHGKANAIDPELLSDLGEAVDAAQHAGAGAVVLTGTGGIFSAGVNLFKVAQGGVAYLEAFLPALTRGIERLVTVPLPMVAAINGHALAGGCIIAAACDLRVMADGPGRIGVTELRVGVPFPGIALETFRAALPGPRGEELVYLGTPLSAAEALQAGLVHRLAPEGELLATATRLAEELAAIPAASFRVTKRALRQPLLDRARASDDAEVRRLWADPQIQESLRRFVEQNVGKR